MESSEDDAGTATNASRRVSAREKDVGLAEDVNATSSFQQEPSETRTACDTPAMSEDNFDGDSVPSPSAQDVNASTEAILDMIDEIVDGPGAPKRVPLESESVDTLFDELEITSEHSNIIIQESSKTLSDNNTAQPAEASPADSAKSDLPLQLGIDSQTESSLSDLSPGVLNTDSVDSLPQSSSLPEAVEPAVSTQPEHSALSDVIPEASEAPASCPPPNIPSSSEEKTVQNITDSSGECETQERTVKCVSSSDKRDNVTVESADITSSDSSVSEGKAVFVETPIRSPLKRRLVRPVPSDRRPDSTVSSTVDSQIDNLQATEQTSSENITKDVTSSSDAVPTLHGNVKPEEIRNLSEISFCKAETSVSSPKKIKLIRQKVISGNSSSNNRDNSINQSAIQSDKDQCQSTSSDSHSLPLPEPHSESSNNINILQSQDSNVPIANCISENPVNSPMQTASSDEHSQSRIEHSHESKLEEIEKHDCNEQILSGQSSSCSPNSSESTKPNVDDNDVVRKTSSISVPNSAPSQTEIVENDLNPDESNLNYDNHGETRAVDSAQNEGLPPLQNRPECTQDVENSEPESSNNSAQNHTISQDSVQIQDHSEDYHHIQEQNDMQVDDQTQVQDQKKQEDEMQVAEHIEMQDHTQAEDQTKQEDDMQVDEHTEEQDHMHVQDETAQEDDMEGQDNSKKEDHTQEHDDTEVKDHRQVQDQTQVQDHTQLEDHVQVQDHTNVEDPTQVQDITKIQDNTQAKDPTQVQADTQVQEHTEVQDDAQVQDHMLVQNPTQVQDPTQSEDPSHVQDHKKVEDHTEVQDHKELEDRIEVNDHTQVQDHTQMQDRPQEQDHTQGHDQTPLREHTPEPVSIQVQDNIQIEEPKPEQENEKRVPPIKLNLSMANLSESNKETEHSSISKTNAIHEESEITKQVPKLTIKLKQPDEIKSPVPKVTIKPIKPPVEQDSYDNTEDNHQVPCVTKINIKPIPKPTENVNEKTLRSQHAIEGSTRPNASVTKLNIKPIPKPPEKINDFHRKSSSSEISESEYSENDETSTSDQASTSDQGPSDVVPKVTIKLGKPGTESEGKFYTEKNIPKLTIKVQQDENDEQEPKLKKMVISQSETPSDTQLEKVPKLTIKTISKSESQPLSPKLTIKPLKPPDTINKDGEIPKMKISTESFASSDGKESPHVPKITIKPVTRSTAMCDSPEHIPVVTKLNIKPILKPTDSGETPEGFEDKVPVVSKLNIKPVLKPKDNDVDSSVDDVPKITKLNIKPIKNPEDNSSEEKDCDELNADIEKNSIPVVTKLNIKPIIKPHDEETLKDSENQSSETGNSSDDNGDHIPVVTKLNIKPIVKPDSSDESSKTVSSSEPSIPVITKLNIKPLIKPGESISPSSPKKEHKIDGHSPPIPVVTKLNIKPVVRPEDSDLAKSKDDTVDKTTSKNPPLVMKINMKTMTENFNNEHASCNNIVNETLPMSPKKVKASNASESKSEAALERNSKRSSEPVNDVLASIKEHSGEKPKQNCVPESVEKNTGVETLCVNKAASTTLDKAKHSQSGTGTECDSVVTGSSLPESSTDKMPVINATHQEHKNINLGPTDSIHEANMMQAISRQKYTSVQNCTLLKKLLENKCSLDKSLDVSPIVNYALPAENKTLNSDHLVESGKSSLEKISAGNLEKIERRSATPDKINDSKKSVDSSSHASQDHCDKANENLTKPLEITISDKVTNQSSGQDSPRIILKINKTDHGPSAKIITEEVKRSDMQQNLSENTQDIVNDKPSPKKYVNSRKKQALDASLNLSSGKRLRSSRIVENTEKTPIARRNMGKRPSTTDTSPPQNKDSDLSLLQSKRLKLGQLLGNKSLTISPVTKTSPPSPTKTDLKQGVKTVNHSLLNNENCSKNGNSKLHNILSNLHAKQKQSLPYNNTNCSEKPQTVASDKEINASVSSLDAVETAPVENSHLELQEMIINENSECREFGTTPEEVSQDPLEVARPAEESPEIVDIPKSVELTPQPKKRGRPRKLPVSEGAKPVSLPVPALEERPQRSLRLMRDRPAILTKPRGRGRGRGGRRVEATTPPTELETIVVIEPADEPEDRPPPAEIDPTSSRIKLPRMTEALDKMPSACVTPLSSRRRNSSGNFSTGESTTELKVMLENSKMEDMSKTPEASGSGRGRGGRGSRGGRGRTPRGRGRGRGGGRGATYMKETMGIYGRVCGPATTTVQLFEEETCMMDDNATPAKPTHLLDEDSQSSVKSSTNESSKMKKSKFADLFDSNKVWTAADVKEYTWPPPDKADVEHKVMMIQEQVAMFLGVKSFKRRYAELKRRTISGEERDYVLRKGLVTEALCDLGITAVDASEVLDIMLSDYPHKYEEYRSYQRQRQLAEAAEEPAEDIKTEEKVVKVEMKSEKPVEHKPELPKIDPEKTRQDMAAAAIASASEWNARTNAMRRGACADLQSLTVQRARAPPVPPPRPHLRPPAGFYPHALLPGQYQHSYRVYTPDQLRYFPLNTVLAAPPAPPSEDWSSESEPDWGSRFSSSEDSDGPTHHSAKRKKLTKTKRSSQAEAREVKETREPREETRPEDLCRVCKLRLEANRRYTHERFLVCANCNAKLHPSCLELSADTIRKCRDYAWQCAECKTCCTCRQPADDDKMLFCDLCDRGFHIYCVGLDTVPSGRWHCVECAICKSCGARSPGGAGPAGGAAASSEPAEWHHQTRRGLGGHKVYSHSLCTPCARAYRIGRYCPLCERSFIGPKGTMQLVICKLCDRQLHQDCVRQTVSTLNVLDYTCAECRRTGITSRAAAVRLAPRTIATLFMAKRRFNKYAHRQYLASRRRQAEEARLEAGEDSVEAGEAGDAEPLRVELRDDMSEGSDAPPDLADTSDPLDATPDA